MNLEASKLFGQLQPGDLDILRQTAQERFFPARIEIFKEGDPGDGLYVVREGLVEISVLINEKERRVFSQVGPGDIFGEMAVLEDKPRSANAVAVEPTSVYFFSRVEVLKLVDRSPALALGLLRDISARLREFNGQYLREVLQAERLAVVGRFARSIVHDLKNPLNIISMTAELGAMTSSTPADRAKARERIARQVERISEMINEILEFTQSTHSGFVLAPMNYADYLAVVLGELVPEAALKSANLELVVPPPPELSVLINPKRLRRVFQNLVHNATDAMAEGGRIQVRCKVSNGGGEIKGAEIITEVEDSGPGIAPEIADRLFEAFATYGKAHGTGLGLSICKRIIEDHQGWINARTEPGRGAIFAFGLPAVGR